MKRLRFIATPAVTLLLMALAPAAHAAAAEVQVHCGDTITVSIKVANDLADCPGNGLIIGADNVTLDLNGHTIDGTGVLRDCPADESCNVGIVNSEVVDGHAHNEAGYHDVTIKNGTVRQFYEAAQYSLLARNMRLLDLNLTESGAGLTWCSPTDSRIERTTVQANQYGVLLEVCRGVSSSNITLANNKVIGNQLASIFVGESHDVTIANNRVVGAWGFGGIFVIGDHARVESNQVSQNEIGIFVDDANDNVVVDNHVFNNRDGIIVFGNRNKVTDNQIADSIGSCPDDKFCGVGISIDGGDSNLVARNDVARAVRDGIRVAAFVSATTPTTGTIVRNNHVTDAALDGYSVGINGPGDVTGTLLQNNTALRSGDDGFDVRSATTTITSNDAEHNADLGIYAVKGVTDGGGNRASNNGAPWQCRNVVCTPA